MPNSMEDWHENVGFWINPCVEHPLPKLANGAILPQIFAIGYFLGWQTCLCRVGCEAKIFFVVFGKCEGPIGNLDGREPNGLLCPPTFLLRAPNSL